MDRISKALKKLSSKERKQVKKVLVKIDKGDLQGLDVKKLKEREDIFRVRKRGMRIIFRREHGDITILALERRSENTY